MTRLCKICAYAFISIYIYTIFYVIYKLLWMPQERSKFKSSGELILDVASETASGAATYTVEIWGKASIGTYLWKHILNGEIRESQGGFILNGVKQIDNITFIFRSGPGTSPTTVPNTIQYLVIVLNGRSPDKIIFSKTWLDYLPTYEELLGVIVVLLGDEQCNNDWLLPYMKSRGGKVDAAFIVYDSTLVDNMEFYQWPLGVSVYRGFPNINPKHVNLESRRSHLCNFVGTVYKNSSREVLGKLLQTKIDRKDCYFLGREKWIPQETEESLNNYINIILDSDFTLNPVGMNSESYRIYESMSLGSIPVLENVVTPGNCDRTASVSPFRLLKEYSAPLIFINSWDELPELLKEQRQKTLSQLTEERIIITHWYKFFKLKMRDKFVSVVTEKFFSRTKKVLL